MCEILIDKLSRDVVLIIGDFLPFEEPFSWFYPNLPSSLIQRRATLTADERLEFFYAILKDARFQDEFSFDQILFERALKEGCRARLDNLLPFLNPQVGVYHLNVSGEGIRWLVDNNIPVDKASLITRMRRSKSDAERILLQPLLKGLVNLQWLNVSGVEPAALKWFFARPNLVNLSRRAKIDLDLMTPEVVRIWLEQAPVGHDKYTYYDLIDYTTDAEMLEYLFKRLYNFIYSERAIALAIELNLLDVLLWWEKKAADQHLTLKLPRYVISTNTISWEVEHWARNYNIKLMTYS